MANEWFRLPETGSGTDTDPFRPDLFGYDVTGWAGNESHPDGAPSWVVRVYADQTTLDNLANETGVSRYDRLPSQALNNMFGQNRTADEWREGFSVG